MTRYANRKAKIRAYQAAHPGTSYRQAARQFDYENQLLLPLRSEEPSLVRAEPASRLVALAAALAELGQRDLADSITAALARWDMDLEQARALAKATQDAYQALTNAPAGLPGAQRRVLEHAFAAAQDNEDTFYPYDDPYVDERLVVTTAFVLLIRAASATSDGGTLAEVAAGILDGLSVEFTADAIRGMDYRAAVPPPADTPSARHAHAAAKTLVAAAAIPFRGDEEWMACQNLIKEAAELAHAAADASRP